MQMLLSPVPIQQSLPNKTIHQYRKVVQTMMCNDKDSRLWRPEV